MSQDDRALWNRRYRDGAYADRRNPSALLADWLPRLDAPGDPPRALDVACGLGRNALFLARNGWRVDAVDVSDVALAALAERADSEGLPVRCLRRDLEPTPAEPGVDFGVGVYDLAVVFRYTNLALLPALTTAVRPGGYLIVELHLHSGAEVVGPKNPQFRVEPGALRAAAAGVEILHDSEGIVEDPDGRRAALARLVARRRAA
jgi:SAM-dependent methyltransferase